MLAISKGSLVGGAEIIDADGEQRFEANFTLEFLPSDEWVLLNLGSNGLANYSRCILNDHALGTVMTRANDLIYCIPSAWLRLGQNDLVVNRYPPAHGDDIWIDSRAFDPTRRRPPVDITPDPQGMLISPAAGCVTRVVQQAEGARLTLDSGLQIAVSLLADGWLRVTAALGDPAAHTLADDYCLAGELTNQVCQVANGPDEVRINAGAGSILMDRQTAAVSVLNPQGQAVLRRLQFLLFDQTLAFKWALQPAEHIFGLGEKADNGLDKRGSHETIWVIHSFEECDKHIPFLMSTEGYGMYLHTSFRAEFDLGAMVADQATGWVNDSRADLFFQTQPRFTDMVRRFAGLTGYSPLPPRWAFGYWQSTVAQITQPELTENIAGFAEKHIPIDVIAIDPNWQKTGFQSWEWARNDYYSQPEQFLALLHHLGLRLALWTCPFVNPSSPLYTEALQHGYVMLNERGDAPGLVDWWMGLDALLMDFTNPEAVHWWGDKLAPLVQSGVVVLKIDGGDTNETHLDLRTTTGYSLKEVHNLYPVLFAKAVYEQMQRVMTASGGSERTLTWIRTGYTGIQRYPCCWGGDQTADFRGGRVLIKAGQGAGLAGIPFWSHDLGGFAGDPTEEYYIRSFQWGLISPLSRGHGPVTAPWKLSARAMSVVARYIRLRYRLLPSIYSYAWFSHTTGEPMMRALVLDNQDDPRVYSADYQYRFGPDLLAAPLYEEGDPQTLVAERQVYLPGGAWYNFWTDEKLLGEQTLTVNAPLDEMPLYVRAGALLVFGPDVERADKIPDDLTLHLYTGGQGHMMYYEDDGHTNDYMSGKRAVTALMFDWSSRMAILSISSTDGVFAGQPQTYHYSVVVHGVKSVAVVRVNGLAVTVQFDPDKGLLSFSFSRKLHEAVMCDIEGS
jgi:alpha-glucosidase (family GH31 glycosyl hydrolase)